MSSLITADGVPVTGPEELPPDAFSEVFSGDPSDLIKQIHELEVQVDKLNGELYTARTRLHDQQVAFEHQQLEMDELREKIELQQDELDRAHGTIYKLIDRL